MRQRRKKLRNMFKNYISIKQTGENMDFLTPDRILIERTLPYKEGKDGSKEEMV